MTESIVARKSMKFTVNCPAPGLSGGMHRKTIKQTSPINTNIDATIDKVRANDGSFLDLTLFPITDLSSIKKLL